MNTEIQVFGAEVVCASCANLPSAKDTASWLEAALGRKFIGQPFTVTYIDVYNVPPGDEIEYFAKNIREDKLFYPLVVINGKIFGEGNIQLKNVVSAMVELGYQEGNE
ncbi:MAG: hypothetical protein K0R71_1242 [Bacillales bacterium]|jgi:disulfide oxidoreductase YuzD|nr:hypothetical protein [Bacillales bacterium]